MEWLPGAHRQRMLSGFARCCCAARQRGAHRWLAQSTRLASAAGPANSSVQTVAQQDAATHATLTPPSRPLKVAIVGRPNVGKSTLFNRLTGGKGKGWSGGSALVTPIPGTTRDRKDGRCSWGGIDMMVTDTGGLEEDAMMAKAPGDMRSLVNSQVTEAVKDSDVVVFLVDVRAGVGPEDAHFARWIHKLGVKNKTVLVANKAEGGVLSISMQAAVSEAYGLSLGDPIAISAEHNEGVSDLTSALVEAAIAAGFTPSTDEDDEAKEDMITLALVGLPNVGKSSLLNATLGQERVITSEVPGTTRDTVLVDYEWRGRRVRLVDTAGIRKWGKRDYTNKLETLSVEEAIRAIRYAHVVVLVLDAELLQMRRQELALANLAFSEGRCMVVAVNKSDLMVTRQSQLQEGVREQLKQLAPQLSTTDVVPTSCVTGQGIQRLLPAVARVYDAWNKRVNTGLLNRWFMDMTKIQPPKPQKGRKVKLKYITQVKARPPTFSLSTNVPEVEESYLRFLKKRLQEDFGLHGMDVRVNTRCTSTDNPYKDKTREKWRKIRAARASRVSKRPTEEQRIRRAKKVWPSKQEVREERQIKAKRDAKKRRRTPGLGARGAWKLRSKL